MFLIEKKNKEKQEAERKTEDVRTKIRNKLYDITALT